MFGLLALIALFFLVGFVLPSNARVERSLVMRAAPEFLFTQIATLECWPNWTAWNTNRFPDLTMRFEGPESGAGATLIAAGKSSGDGTVCVTEANPASGISYRLDFNHGTQLFDGAIRYRNAPDGLNVTWTLDAKLGPNPLKRWAGLAMDSLMGGDMEKGLQNLQDAAEGRP